MVTESHHYVPSISGDLILEKELHPNGGDHEDEQPAVGERYLYYIDTVEDPEGSHKQQCV